MHRIDIVGTRSGRWTVISRAENTKQGQAQYLCRCDCGNEKVLKSIIIRRGISKSCGCYHREDCIKRSTRHGHATGGISPTYHSWASMVARCTNNKIRNWLDYGGRGITVCERWMKFENFLADMGEKPAGRSLDRIDNNKGYSPENCRWATDIEQARNKRSNNLITYNGVTKTLQEWANDLGINSANLIHRLRKWDFNRAMSEPNYGTGKERALRRA